MALESQGVVIRRGATSLATAASSVLSISSGTTSKLLSSDTAEVDFVTNGFTTGQRIITNSTLSTGVMTAKSVAASVIEVYETATADATTALSFTGSSMENIGEITGFSGPSGAAAVIDVTNLQSTAKEKLIGIRDEGNITLDVNLSSSSTDLHFTLKDDRAARAKRSFDIKLTDSSTSNQPTGIYFDGYVTGFALTGAVDDVLKASLTLEITTALHYIDKTST